MARRETDTKRALGYVRVSTDDQADSGQSLLLQREKVEAMATVQDLELLDVIEDAGASAKSLRRDGMGRLLELVDAGAVDVVVIYKLDRLTRSVRDLGDLLERFDRAGVSLVSVSESLDTGTAAGRLVLNVMASVAQWEREVIGERTREALAAKARRGERVGQIPFGYRLAADGVHLEEDHEEQETLRDIQAMRAAGWSWQRIAADLNRRGLARCDDREWTRQNTRSVWLRVAA